MVRISVIVPTRDRPDDLERCLDALDGCAAELVRAGLGTLLEVVLVDDASARPVTVDPARWPGSPVRVLRNQQRLGAGRSRQSAAAGAAGDVLAFLDDDAAPRGDWLTVLAERLSPRVPALTGRVLRFDAGLVSRARQARYDERYAGLAAHEPVDFFAGGNSGVLAEAFRDVGGFHRVGVGGDNSLADSLAQRATPVRFEPDLVVVHRNSKGGRRALSDAVLAGRDHPARLGPRAAGRLALRSAVGETWPVRQTNRALGLAYASGRAARRRPPLPGTAVAERPVATR